MAGPRAVRCRALDMALDEARVLLDLRDRPQQECAGVNDLLDTHIGHVVERIRALTALETSTCAILRALGTEGSYEAWKLGAR